jgi:hypothetical protein
VRNQRDPPAAYEIEHLPRLVDLDVVGAAVARERPRRVIEDEPQTRVGTAGAREAVHLLEGEHRLHIVYAEVAVGALERVALRRQALRELPHARPTRAEPDVGAADVRVGQPARGNEPLRRLELRNDAERGCTAAVERQPHGALSAAPADEPPAAVGAHHEPTGRGRGHRGEGDLAATHDRRPADCELHSRHDGHADGVRGRAAERDRVLPGHARTDADAEAPVCPNRPGACRGAVASHGEA